ncbi:lipoprotein [Bordetella pertussis]|nr:lipoprotein [Bordetella pertussis]
MKARFALLALGLALAGCANVKDIRDREPAFYGSPQRSAQEYAACVSAAWKGLGVPVEQREIRNGYELVSRGSLGVDGWRWPCWPPRARRHRATSAAS